MHLTRRTFVTALGALPAISSLQGRARETSDILPLDTPGLRVIGISPDGSTFVGRDRDDVLVFLSANSLAELSRTESITAFSVIDEASISWSPNGQTIAFSLRAWELMTDSDIFLVSIADGMVSNATHTDKELGLEPLLNASDEIAVDVFPVWIDEATLLFARHQRIDDVWRCSLCEMNAETREITEIVLLSDHEIQFVSGHFRWVDDHQLVAWVTLSSGMPGLALIDLNGDVSLIDTGNVLPIGAFSTDGINLLMLEPRESTVWQLPLSGEDAWINAAELFQLDEDQYFAVMPIYGPQSGDLAAVIGPGTHVVVKQGASISDLGTLTDAEDTTLTQMIWANDRLLVVSRTASWMINITHA